MGTLLRHQWDQISVNPYLTVFSDSFQFAKLVLSTLLPYQIGDDQARS